MRLTVRDIPAYSGRRASDSPWDARTRQQSPVLDNPVEAFDKGSWLRAQPALAHVLFCSQLRRWRVALLGLRSQWRRNQPA
jgi:hypothetical protein